MYCMCDSYVCYEHVIPTGCPHDASPYLHCGRHQVLNIVSLRATVGLTRYRHSGDGRVTCLEPARMHTE